MFTQKSRAGETVRTVRRVRAQGVHTKVSGGGEDMDSKDLRCSHNNLGWGRE